MVKLETSAVFSKNQKDFVGQVLEDNSRVDGRTFTQFRRLVVGFGRASGQCDVSLGKTRVLGSIRCRAVEPSMFRPKEGFLDFGLQVSPCCDSIFADRKRPAELEETRRLLDRVFKTSKAVDVESLCLVPGKKVWSLKVDLNVVDYDGNLTDVAAITALTSLLHFRKPDVTIRGESITIHTAEEREPVPLNIQHVPIVVTFGIMNDGIALADPTLLEASVSSGELSLAINTLNQVCVVNKIGGKAVPQTRILDCLKIATHKVDYIVSRITEAVAADAIKKKKEGLSQFSWAKDRQSVGEMENIAKGIEKAIEKAEGGVKETGKKRRAKSLSPDDPDVQIPQDSLPSNKKQRPVVSLKAEAKLTLLVPDQERGAKKGDTAMEDAEEEVEEVEEVEEIEEV